MMVVDATLAPGEREALLAEVALQLPLWLQRAAQPQPQVTDQLVDLLGYTPQALRRVRAVHLLLADATARFVAALPAAMRAPRPASERPVELAGVVRGPVNWGATARLQATGQPATYVVMPRRRVFNTPEHRALAWALARLGDTAAIAMGPSDDDTADPASWTADALAVRRRIHWARRVDWLSGITPRRPDQRVRGRLRRSRDRFVAGPLSDVLDALIAFETTDGPTLASLLAQRYFIPERDWRLFEVVVLIRLDRALADAAAGVRRALMSESGQVGAYRIGPDHEVRLRYQGWPAAASRRQAAAARHGVTVAPSQPDIIVERLGVKPDCVVLELKASRRPGTLGDGLSQLLGYLHERPSLFGPQPAGWLVPLPNSELEAVDPDPGEPLWIVAADQVADAIVLRMATAC